jgi:signal transduction histidine kinase
MIERMLDLAEAEARRLTLDQAPLHPVEVLQKSLASLGLFAQKQKVRLTVAGPLDCTAQMQGDADRLRQAFTNLLHNAIKFTPAGGEVRVSGSAHGGVLSIRIADAGIGMEPDLLASVVRPFHRLRSALDGQHQGAGLGLPFAKAIVDLHGGRLVLASEVGAGTTVTVELPIQAISISEAA